MILTQKACIKTLVKLVLLISTFVLLLMLAAPLVLATLLLVIVVGVDVDVTGDVVDVLWTDPVSVVELTEFEAMGMVVAVELNSERDESTVKESWL